MSPISMPNMRLAGSEMPSRPSKIGTLLITVPIKKAKPRVPMAINAPERRRKITPKIQPIKAAIKPPAINPTSKSTAKCLVNKADV